MSFSKVIQLTVSGGAPKQGEKPPVTACFQSPKNETASFVLIQEV